MLVMATTLSVIFLALLITIPPIYHKVSLDLPTAPSTDTPTIHRLDIAANGEILLDTVPCRDLLELRQAMDFIAQTLPESDIEIRPHPEVRYEDFLMTLATLKKANMHRLRLKFEPPALPSKEGLVLGETRMSSDENALTGGARFIRATSFIVPERTGCAAALKLSWL